MIKKYWRVSYNNIGIYEALKRHLWENNKINTWNELKNSDNFTWLPLPNTYLENNRSYFTEIGYKMFIEKTLPIIKQYLDNDSIVIKCFDFNYENLKILYEDEYQIVIE